MHSTLTYGRYRIDMFSDQVETTSMGPRPDPSWTYTDRAGHEHSARIPGTLRWVEDGVDLVDDGDGYTDEMPFGHQECIRCGEHIEPGMIESDGTRQFVTGGQRLTAASDDGRAVELGPSFLDRVREVGMDVALDEVFA